MYTECSSLNEEFCFFQELSLFALKLSDFVKMILLFRLLVVWYLFVLIWNGNYDRISCTEFAV